MIRYEISKFEISANSWLVMWRNQYGARELQYFNTESEADKFIGA